jgi:hypothetical protein
VLTAHHRQTSTNRYLLFDLAAFDSIIIARGRFAAAYEHSAQVLKIDRKQKNLSNSVLQTKTNANKQTTNNLYKAEPHHSFWPMFWRMAPCVEGNKIRSDLKNAATMAALKYVGQYKLGSRKFAVT